MELGQEGVNISCALNVTGLFWIWFQRVNNQEVSSSTDGDRLANVINTTLMYTAV